MSFPTVNHSILNPVLVKHLTPTVKTGEIGFSDNTANPKEETIYLDKENVLSVETLTFKSMGMLIIFTQKEIHCHLYWVDFKKNSLVSKSSVYYPEEYATPKDIYGWLVGSMLTDVTKDLWFFNQGSGTRGKMGWILNYLMCTGEVTPFSAAFGNKILSFQNRAVNIRNQAGEIVYQSRITRLQKTLLKD